MSRLTADQVALQLEHLPDWQVAAGCLVKTFEFADFASVLSFMVHVAFYAEQLEHYPNWQNHFTTLSVHIGDPNQQEVYSRDVQLAKRMEAVYSLTKQA